MFQQSYNVMFWFSAGSQKHFQHFRILCCWDTRSCASLRGLLLCDYIWCPPLLPWFLLWDRQCSIISLSHIFHPCRCFRRICWCVISVYTRIFAFMECWLCGGVFHWMFITFCWISIMYRCCLGISLWYFCLLWLQSMIETSRTYWPLFFIICFLRLHPQRCIRVPLKTIW